MGQVLYRKYRSRSFAEIVGQEHITKTLQNALKSRRIAHAYLFTGPRGVGKTSVARILAHEVNNLAYSDESIHLDIIEIDAASNRRIDEIRELRERVHIAPTSAKYKVYIIDEVHMLTKEAFNALLKTLEEPPAHCIFILATTEEHKLPDTIVSRTQRFGFKTLSRSQVIEHLGTIAKKEKIDISTKALELLAEHGEGTLRDSISMLDQLSASKKPIKEQQVLEMLGLPPAEAIDKLSEAVENGSVASVLATLESMREQGVNPAVVARQLAKGLRSKALAGLDASWLPALLKELIAVPASAEPADYLEICLLEAASQNNARGALNSATVSKSHSELSAQDATATKPISAVNRPRKAGSNFDLKDWDRIVNRTKSEAATLYSALRLAKPELSGSTLKLFFEFPLHQKKLTQAANADLLGKLIEETTGVKLKIETLVDKSKLQPKVPTQVDPKAAEQPTGDPLNDISNIFGGAEVLES